MLTKEQKLAATQQYYAGIGSRETPPEVLKQMGEIAKHFEAKGYILRSGGAQGADRAFSDAVQNAEIWIPWESFYGHPTHAIRIIHKTDEAAFASVNQFHPSGPYLSDSVKRLMARNYRQVIGQNAPNSSFIVCWTKDGGPTGGTGQALRIAQHFGIKIYNLFDSQTIDQIYLL